MPSMDIVSRADMQEIDNAVNNAIREISTRYDFRKTKSEIELDKKNKVLHIVTEDEMGMNSIGEILIGHFTKRKIDPKFLDFKEIQETMSLREVKRDVAIREGLPKETCQKIVKMIKGMKLKVQPAIQENQVRVTGNKIDDLQTVMKFLKEQDLDAPLQFVNLKR